jgi:hypothetical protein
MKKLDLKTFPSGDRVIVATCVPLSGIGWTKPETNV